MHPPHRTKTLDATRNPRNKQRCPVYLFAKIAAVLHANWDGNLRQGVTGGDPAESSVLKAVSGGGARQHVVLELGAQGGLLNFAGGGVGDFGDEGDVVRQPPFRDLAFEEGQ